jgi:cyanate permease
MLTGIYGLNAFAIYGLILWMPQIIKSFGGLTNTQVGLIAAIPFACAAIGMMAISTNSDRTCERKFHLAFCGFVGGLFLAASALASSSTVAFVLLCISASTLWGTNAVFWTVPTLFLRSSAAAGGIALINSIAQIGGFAAPFLVGWLHGVTSNFSTSLLVLAAAPVIGSFLSASLRLDRPKRPAL